MEINAIALQRVGREALETAPESSVRASCV